MEDKQPDPFVVEVLNINLIKLIHYVAGKIKKDKIDRALLVCPRGRTCLY